MGTSINRNSFFTRRLIQSRGERRRIGPYRFMTTRFLTGIEVLLEGHLDLVKGHRVGLVTHPAALTTSGQWSAELLWHHPDVNLACLLGPEHGVYGNAGAGEPVSTSMYPGWNIPVFSLYGDARKPTQEMLDAVDVFIVDLQDLGVRCYTYVSTLYLVMEAAAEAGKRVIVADRPIPLPDVFDGPMPDPSLQSFVAHAPLPLVYGMTQGETAMYLYEQCDWELDIHILEMWGYKSGPFRRAEWPPWVPPSTGIRSWESAWCYPATVFCEALPSLDCDRGGILPFQVLGATWMNGQDLVASLAERVLPGVTFFPHTYIPHGRKMEEVLVGLRLVVTDPKAFRPVTTGITILETLQRVYGPEPLWNADGVRPGFFDQLCGTASVRTGLQSGAATHTLARAWREDMRPFVEARSDCLLYP